MPVKTGDSGIDLPALGLANDLKGWIVFSTTGAYRGRRSRRIEILDRGEVLRFMTNRRSALPPIVNTWLDTVA